jgi:serine protein kinase
MDSIQNLFYSEFNPVEEILTLDEFFEQSKTNSMMYASPAERMLKAIGEPVLLDTSKDPKLGRIHQNATIRVYPAFEEDFYGIQDSIADVVSYFKHASQNLEESKTILYLLGPVGSAKSTLAEKIKELMEKEPVWVLDGSPVFETPFGLFNMYQKQAEELYPWIPPTLWKTIPSPWAIEKLKDCKGDLSQFKVRKIYPSRVRQVCISRIEPGDDNNSDIGTLVGEIDIRMIDRHAANSPKAYNFSGALCRGNNGIVEYVEMFKSPIKMLNPLLTATQDRMYSGVKNIGNIPFRGIILSHSNFSEWESFKNDSKNEAFIDRIYTVKVPYTLRFDEEVKIYKKLIKHSELRSAPIAPQTLETLAQFAVMSRLDEPQNSTLYSKMRVYNGESIKAQDPTAKTYQEYKESASSQEGSVGISTRFAFKILAKTFNYDTEEIAANPIHLIHILKNMVSKDDLPEDKEKKLLAILDNTIIPKYLDQLEKDIRGAFLESYQDLAQNMFEQYVTRADSWVSDQELRDQTTGLLLDRESLNAELEKIEKGAGIANPKDFRHDIVMFATKYRANNKGQFPRWNEYEKIRMVIEKTLIDSTKDVLPVISFSPVKRTQEEERKHVDFISSMEKRGYTKRQTRILVDFFMRARFSK